MANANHDLKKPWYKDKNVQGIVAAGVGLLALVFKVDLGQGQAITIASQSLAGIGILWAFGSRIYERIKGIL